MTTGTSRSFRRVFLPVAVLLLSIVAAVAGPIEDVSQAGYTSFLGVAAPGSPAGILYTHNGSNRGFGADHDLARTNILNAFTSFGLNASLFPFTYSSSTYYNVVGVKPGIITPNTVYIVGAHYDSVNNPGADYNASGVAGVLEAANVLSQYTFASTLIFIAFDREEQGLVGSSAYAAAHAADNIQGMISLDMIAYNPAGPNHDRALLYGRTAPIENAMIAALAPFGITATMAGTLDASDHAPFEWNLKPATLLIEGAVWSNPYYHQPTDSVDTLGYIDYDYATRMTRGTVAYLTASAVLVETSVPEPSCAVLLLIAGVVRLTRRRRP